MTTATREYLSAAETAKLVRQALKRAFPGQKFSVVSDTYSGGASINVRWTDGPRQKDVEAVAEQYQGGRFDGMIDFKYSVTHYLRADGSVYLANDPGTGGQRGSNPGEDNTGLAPLMPPDVRLVRFGADFIFCHREVSDRDAKIGAASAWLMQHCVTETAPGPIAYAMFGNRYVSDIATAMAYDYIPGEDWKATFDRFTNR